MVNAFRFTVTFALGALLLQAGFSFEGCAGRNSPAPAPAAMPTPMAPSGMLRDGRFAATATLLADGRVLVAGGVALEGNSSPSAEIYDPANAGFTLTGSMLSGRAYHTATLLKNGRVLMAGGVGKNGTPVREAEIFDPAAGDFSPTGNMFEARYNFTATLLTDGKVLIAGGETDPMQSGGVDTAELYDPATGTFGPTGAVTRFYDPEADKFFYKGKMGTVRAKHSATLLPDGRVLIVGGKDSNEKSESSAEVYNPADGKFTPVGSMRVPRSGHRATLLRTGKVLITGGIDAQDHILSAAELFDPATRIFTPSTKAFPASGTDEIDPRYEHTATLLPDGRMLLTGGSSSQRILGSAELYEPSSGSFTCVGGRSDGPASPCIKSLTEYRSNALAVGLRDGSVLILGGYNFARSVGRSGLSYGAPLSILSSAEIFNSAAGTFTSTMALPQNRRGPLPTH